MDYKSKYLKYLQKGGNLTCQLNTYISRVRLHHIYTGDEPHYLSDKNIIYTSQSTTEFISQTNDQIKELLFQLFSECTVANVLLFVESEDNQTITNKINEIIMAIVSDNLISRLLNVSIINSTISTSVILYNYMKGDKPVFKKVTNVFPIGQPIKSCIGDNTIPPKIEFNKSINTEFDINTITDGCTSRLTTYGDPKPISRKKTIKSVDTIKSVLTDGKSISKLLTPSILKETIMSSPIRSTLKPSSLISTAKSLREHTKQKSHSLTPTTIKKKIINTLFAKPATPSPAVVHIIRPKESVPIASESDHIADPEFSTKIDIVYRFMDTFSAEPITNIKDTWWYKWYFGVPLCAYGRLLQSSGTCWCNAIINSLVLTLPISKMMINKWNGLDAKKRELISSTYSSFGTFRDSAEPLETLLFATINILLINKNKAINYDSNFISELAARIKGKSEHNSEDYYRHHDGLEYGDAYDPYLGIKVLMNALFRKNMDYVCIENPQRETFISSYNNSVTEQRTIIDRYNKLSEENKIVVKNAQQIANDNNITIAELNKMIKEYNANKNPELLEKIKKLEEEINIKKTMIATINSKIIENNAKLEEESKLINELRAKIMGFNNLSSKINKFIENVSKANTIVSASFSDLLVEPIISTPKIIFIDVSANGAPKIITIDGHKYVLQASVIHIIDAEHAIVGLVCNEKYYVYDSNNYISHDNWHVGSFDEYKKTVHEAGGGYITPRSILKLAILIYVLESEL